MNPCLCVAQNEAPDRDCWICGGSGVILNNLHRRLLETKSLLHVSTAGAGPELLRRIWSELGISEYYVGGAMPYFPHETHAFLGHPPDDSYVSREVAFDMAMASYIRAVENQVVMGRAGSPVGLGITAATASNRWPKGGQRAHIVVVTRDRILDHHLMMVKGLGKEVRALHDADIARMALSVLEFALDPTCPPVPEADTLALERFYRYPIFNTNGRRLAALRSGPKIYLPATLNPIHDGHRLMAKEAEDARSPEDGGRVQVIYLVSSVSPHKGKLSVQDMLQRAGMLLAERWRDDEVDSRTVEFTRDEPLFLDKARKRPGSTFIIGADTMQRMLDPVWGVDPEALIAEFENLKTKFLVMGRLIDDKWLTCRDIPMPRWTSQLLFQPLGGRVDVSSTQLRAKQSADQSPA